MLIFFGMDKSQLPEPQPISLDELSLISAGGRATGPGRSNSPAGDAALWGAVGGAISGLRGGPWGIVLGAIGGGFAGAMSVAAK